MIRVKQAIHRCDRQLFHWLSLCACLCLTGCGSTGFSIENALSGTGAPAAPDRSIVTGSIPQTPPADQSESGMDKSDERTIRNAVTSAIVSEIGAEGIGWANAATGSRGAIHNVQEKQEASALCRSFSATRESYKGVHLYRGEACMKTGQRWMMSSFMRIE